MSIPELEDPSLSKEEEPDYHFKELTKILEYYAKIIRDLDRKEILINALSTEISKENMKINK
jgi:hypothetical protein